jgi:hypothetical protein
MLFNLNEGSEPFTMPHFIAWLERHPRDQEYSYIDSCNCLNAQYHKEFHCHYVPPGLYFGPNNEFPKNGSFISQAEWIAWGDSHEEGTHTFGAAADRARLTYNPELELVK